MPIDNLALAFDERRRLLPALLRFGEEGAQELWRAEAMRYVEFCLAHLRSQDAALHQLAVALYSLQVCCWKHTRFEGLCFPAATNADTYCQK